ncbi:tubulin-like doman-containing protein [Solibaculum mannosilyticum]|uniref:tubulin-like doman-containing protein n=1 Tax=Solibaculum mannosilyticum TaxID=2780922 RepID=UPI0007A86794|nr:hypothetical protein BN3661_00598 [Eubacteriaceae bacterium CHKCI005]
MKDSEKRRLLESLEVLRRPNGFFSDPTAKIVDEPYLIFGIGGSGREIAAKVKQKAADTFLPSECQQKLGIRVMDSHHGELESAEEEGVFTTEEIIKLPYQGVYESFPNNPFVTPFLPEGFQGTIKDRDGFKGTGAAATPLTGRILLTSDGAVNLLKEKIKSVVNMLMKPNALGTPSRLHIVFVLSFAGGMGTGSIVDTTYIMKRILQESNIQYDMACYALTPFACHDDSKEKANFIATLKTVLHFMNLSETERRFSHTYAPGFTVDTNESIFYTLFLVDGSQTGNSSKDFHGLAVETVSRSIIQTMTK